MTLSVATVFSSINALTLSPALVALLLKPSKGAQEAHADREQKEAQTRTVRGEEPVPPPSGGEENENQEDSPPEGGGTGGEDSTSPHRGGILGHVFRPFNWVFDHATTGYAWLVAKAIALWPVTLAVYGVLAAATYFAITTTPTGFLPEEDQGYFFINVQLPEASKLDRTDDVLRRVETLILDSPGVESTIAVAGFSLLAGVNAPNAALCVVIMKDWPERPDWPVGKLVETLGPVLGGIPDATVFAFNPPAIRGLGQAGGFEMQIRDESDLGLDVLAQATQAFLAAASADPQIGRALTTFNAQSPQEKIVIDREQHLKLGIPPEVVNDTLSTMLGGAYVNDFNYFGRVYRVYAQADTQYRQTESDLLNLQVRNEQGSMTPLDSFVTIEPIVGPQNVVRYNLATSATVNGSGAPGVSSGEVLTIVDRLANDVLPAGMGYDWTGVTYQQERAGNTAPIVFALAVVVVFLVLAAQYESWTIPLAILLAVPLGVLVRDARPAHPRHGQRRLRPDRPRAAGRAGREERDPPRRVRRAEAQRGRRRGRRCRRRRPAPFPADPDDRLLVRVGHPPADGRHRRRCRLAPDPRHRRRRRHGLRHRRGPGDDAGLLRRDPADQGALFSRGPKTKTPQKPDGPRIRGADTPCQPCLRSGFARRRLTEPVSPTAAGPWG